MDDVQSGGDGREELLKLKEEATEIVGEGGFQLHKWHSDVLEIERQSTNDLESPQTSSIYAKLAVGTQGTKEKTHFL